MEARPYSIEARCRWCDRILPAADAECEVCAEEELQRRVGKRGDPAQTRRLLGEVLSIVDLSEYGDEIRAYEAAVRAGRELLPARRRLRARIEAAAASDDPRDEAANGVRARVDMLEAILAYPFDYTESFRLAARAAARVLAWPAALRAVAGGPPPGDGPPPASEPGPPDWSWISRTAWESAWRAAYHETVESVAERLYWTLVVAWQNR